jgi:hypothetical protein
MLKPKAMTIKNLFIFGAIVSVFFGLTLIFAPEALAKVVFINPTFSDAALALTRNYGIFLTSVGIAVYTARNSKPSTARRGYVIQTTVSGILLTLWVIYGIFAGIDNSNAWGIVILTAILGIWGTMVLLNERVVE